MSEGQVHAETVPTASFNGLQEHPQALRRNEIFRESGMTNSSAWSAGGGRYGNLTANTFLTSISSCGG